MGDFNHKRSKLTSQNVLNIMAPTQTKSCSISYSVAEQTIKETAFVDTEWTFNTFSFFSPVPVFWSYSELNEPDPTLTEPDDRTHYWEGGRFSMSLGFRIKKLFFKPVDSPSEAIIIRVKTG